MLKVVETFKKGEIITGIVERIEPYAAFIKVSDKLVGILYKENVSNVKIRDIRDKLKIGDKIKVIVKKYDYHTGKLLLSRKELTKPSERIIARLHENDVLEGIARNKEKNSIFIEIKPDLVGLADYKRNISYGDKVKVLIKRISPIAKKIKLEILD